ncbi:hypothetical protein, partial [Nocardioides aquaticus]
LAARLRSTPLAADPDEEAPHVFDQIEAPTAEPTGADPRRWAGLLLVLVGLLAAAGAVWLLLGA